MTSKNRALRAKGVGRNPSSFNIRAKHGSGRRKPIFPGQPSPKPKPKARRAKAPTTGHARRACRVGDGQTHAQGLR